MPCTFCAPPLQVSPLTAVAEREKAPRGVAAPAAQLFHLCTKTSSLAKIIFKNIIKQSAKYLRQEIEVHVVASTSDEVHLLT